MNYSVALMAVRVGLGGGGELKTVWKGRDSYNLAQFVRESIIYAALINKYYFKKKKIKLLREFLFFSLLFVIN